MTFTQVLTDLGGGIAGLFVSILQTLATIFFTISETGVVSMTPLGYLALIGLVIGIVYKLFNWVVRLIKGR
jgi:hypothetical protein